MFKRKLVLFIICIALVCSSAIIAKAAPAYKVTSASDTLKRGDSVTFTVNVSGTSKTKSLGALVSYDPNVFEFVSGEMLVTGALLSDFTGGTGVAAFTAETDVNGDIASFVLKVKTDATFGETTVGAEVNVGGVKELTETTVKVICQHSYGSLEQHNETQHKQACTCGDVKYSDHTWNNGEVATPATHTTVGSMKYTCTGCGATKTTEIPKDSAHAYGAIEQHNDAQHKQSCVCGDVKYANHTWNSGEVITPSTHTTVGSMKYTCTGCSVTKNTEIPALSDHEYEEWEEHSETQHKHACICGDVQYADHTWNNGEVVTPATHTTEGEMQYTCTGCGVNKKAIIPVMTDHVYGECEQHNETQHKQFCVCGDVKYSDHTWNDGEIVTPATYETKGEKKFTCTVCGETKTEEIPVLEKPVTPEEPINPEKPDASETPDDQEKNPQTGDTLTFALVLFALAAVGVICVITLAKKKNIKA